MNLISISIVEEARLLHCTALGHWTGHWTARLHDRYNNNSRQSRRTKISGRDREKRVGGGGGFLFDWIPTHTYTTTAAGAAAASAELNFFLVVVSARLVQTESHQKCKWMRTRGRENKKKGTTCKKKTNNNNNKKKPKSTNLWTAAGTEQQQQQTRDFCWLIIPLCSILVYFKSWENKSQQEWKKKKRDGQQSESWSCSHKDDREERMTGRSERRLRPDHAWFPKTLFFSFFFLFIFFSPPQSYYRNARGLIRWPRL